MDSSTQCMPFVVLQGFKTILSPVELRLARQVCKEWAAELASSVQSVQLPPELWFYATNPSQAAALQKLLATWSFKQAQLIADSQEDADAATVSSAMSLLHSVAALQTITVRNLGCHSGSWSAVLGSCASLSSCVTALELLDVRLPGPDGLDALSGLCHINSLVLQSSSSNKLQQEHLAAIAKMPRLTRLKLVFRAMNGNRLSPLTLDCLGRPGSNLRHLEVRYTGMSELATGVCFAAEEFLPGCSSLETLVLSRVPAPSLRGLFKLQQLRQLAVTQLAPLSETQARSLSLCTQLQQLGVDNMPLELLPRLASLTELTSLLVTLWLPSAAGGQDLPGGANITALAALSNLVSLRLHGPVMLTSTDISTLATGCPKLQQLSLMVTLLDAAEGFSGFLSLNSISIQPWAISCSRVAGQAGLGGSEEGPLLDSSRGLELQLWHLPESLKCFEGKQVFVRNSRRQGAAPGLDADATTTATATSAAAAASMAAAGPQFTALQLHYSPDTLFSSQIELPLSAMSGLASLDIKHPWLQAHQVAEALSACCGSLTRLSLDVSSAVSPLSKPMRPAKHHTPAASAGIPPAWARSTSSGGGGASDGSNKTSSGGGNKTSGGGSSGRVTRNPSFSYSSSSSGGGFYTAAAAAGAAAAAVAAAATAAGSGMAVATAAAATAGAATAGAISRNSSFSLGTRNNSGSIRAGSYSNSGSMSVLESLSSASFTLQSMGSTSLTTMLGDALWVGAAPGGATASSMSSMGQSLAEGPGMDSIGQCTKLTELKLVIGERVLSARVRAAIAALPALCSLTLAVAADAPAAAARDLGNWVVRMRGLERVTFAVDGPGSSEVLLELCDRVAAALPACEVYTLRHAGR